MVKRAKAPPKVDYKAILAERAHQKKAALLAEIDDFIEWTKDHPSVHDRRQR